MKRCDMKFSIGSLKQFVNLSSSLRTLKKKHQNYSIHKLGKWLKFKSQIDIFQKRTFEYQEILLFKSHLPQPPSPLKRNKYPTPESNH